MTRTGRSSSQPEGMIIQHITYEEARGGWSPTRPSSATEKVKNYFSRLSHFMDHGFVSPKSARDEKTTAVWPRMDAAPSNGMPEVEQLPTQKHRAERAVPKKEAEAEAAKPASWNSVRPRAAATRRREEEQVQIETRPSRVRKPHFKTLVSEKLTHEKSTEAAQGSESMNERFLQAQRVRRAIHEGKLEIVIPTARRNASSSTQRAPPRPAQNPFYNPSPPYTASLSTSKTNSLVEMLRTSADILDETRREIASKFRPPFEHLNHPSFSLSRQFSKLYASPASSESEESFGCIGEDFYGEGKRLTDSDQEATRRLSEEGTNPWVDTALRDCRLCQRTGVARLRGLCRECEREFMRPGLASVEDHRTSWTSSVYSDGLKPTPPLKNRDVLLQKKLAGDGELVVGKELPSIPIDVESDDEEFERWHREELERTERALERWSNGYANKDHARFADEDDHTPLITARERKGKEGPSQRNHSFYDFSDDDLEVEEKVRFR